MLKTKDFFDTMIQNYFARENPGIAIDFVDQRQSESYELKYLKGKIIIKADNPFGAILGWQKALIATQSGYIRENLGRHSPRFPLRIFQGGVNDIPEAIQNGYNAVVCLPDDDRSPFLDYGLKIILKLKEPIDNLDGVHAVLVESAFFEDDEYKTRIEMIEEDLVRWENFVNKKCELIYQLVHGTNGIWMRWFLNLCIKAARGTTLAFPASCPEHIWEKFRQNLDIIHTPLLVIMDRECDLSEQLVDHVFLGGVSKNSKSQFFLN